MVVNMFYRCLCTLQTKVCICTDAFDGQDVKLMNQPNILSQYIERGVGYKCAPLMHAVFAVLYHLFKTKWASLSPKGFSLLDKKNRLKFTVHIGSGH